MDLAAWLEEQTTQVPGSYWPSLMVDVRTALLVSARLADLKLLAPGESGEPSAGRGDRPDQRRPMAAAGRPRAGGSAERVALVSGPGLLA